jgi:ABC-type Zn uptake system ZnuABC Zn-binding protein ZnuA
MAGLHIARKMHQVSSNELLVSHASTAYLEERKEKFFLRKKKIQSHKEKDRCSA